VLQGPVQAVEQQKPSIEQSPDSHMAPLVHVCPFTSTHPPPALQTSFAAHPPSRPAVTGAHVPLAHELHGPVQASLQQNWSAPEEQMPLAQVVTPVPVQGWPLVGSQVPATLHARLVPQAPGLPSATSPHDAPPAHLEQGPLQAVAQQKPSVEQKPVSHWLPMVHICPGAGSHEPVALHAWFAGHAPCEPAARTPQVAPTVHAAQGPLQVTAQQTSSPPEQKPLAQSAPFLDGLHVFPLAPSHWSAGLHASSIGQSMLLRHGTQLPMPSHSVPPLVHAVLATAGFEPGTPVAEQVPTRHGLEVGGRSSTSTTFFVPPMPSQTVSMQSPGESLVGLVPASASPTPQAPAVQVAIWHAFFGWGHGAGVEQAAPPMPAMPPMPVATELPPAPPVLLVLPSKSNPPRTLVQALAPSVAAIMPARSMRLIRTSPGRRRSRGR
jgi:hypothetical protein